jgi:hypothetical protein
MVVHLIEGRVIDGSRFRINNHELFATASTTPDYNHVMAKFTPLAKLSLMAVRYFLSSGVVRIAGCALATNVFAVE